MIVLFLFSSIRSSLESHDEVELEAAIFATDKLCSHSRYTEIQCFNANNYEFVFIRQNLKGDYLISVYREFASGLYNKISQLIEGKKVNTLGLTKNDQQWVLFRTIQLLSCISDLGYCEANLGRPGE